MLKIGKLPDRTPVKLTINLTPRLHQDLSDYAAVYRETYGQDDGVAELVPHMLRSFLESDRAFAKARQSLTTNASSPAAKE
jgi:hypothetical protein